MNALLFSRDADTELSRLQVDHGRSELYDRVNDILDAIEDDPADQTVRRRRYNTPPVWGVPVHGSGEDWLVLWSETDEGLVIHYLGPDLQ